MARKPSYQSRLVLQALMDSLAGETYGFELAQITGLPSGTIYPILQRLERERLVEGRWADVRSGRQRRRRRYYKLTGHGRQAARSATESERHAFRLLAPGLEATS